MWEKDKGGGVMERLTNIGSNGEIWITDNDETRRYGRKESAYKKLAQYEDLEEQGLLLRLPCKVGDTVFKLKKHNYCPVGICSKDISCSECRANTPFGIVEGKFKLNELKEIGKTVFLTKTEAEQKLKKMESD